jgi:hypothetical protein
MAPNLIRSDSEIEPSDRNVWEKNTSQDDINDYYDSPPRKKENITSCDVQEGRRQPLGTSWGSWRPTLEGLLYLSITFRISDRQQCIMKFQVGAHRSKRAGSHSLRGQRP